MNHYDANRGCPCARCSAQGLMGPVVLVTLGVLFLIAEFSRWDFHETWPVLLVVIGAIKVLQSTASTQGHRPQAQMPPPPPPPATGGQGGEGTHEVEHV